MPPLAFTTRQHPSRITPFPTPISTTSRVSHQHNNPQALKKTRTTLLATEEQKASLLASINKPIWESPYFRINTASKKPTLALICEKFNGFNEERCRTAGPLPIPKLFRESVYLLLKGMVEHYTEHCVAIAEAIERFQGAGRTCSLAEEMRALMLRMQGVMEHIEWSYEDDGLGEVCCFWETMSEAEGVRNLFHEVRKTLGSVTEGTYEFPRALSCSRVSLVAAVVCQTRMERVWNLDDDLLEEMVATHIGMGAQEHAFLFDRIRHLAYCGKEDSSTMELRVRSEVFVREYVKKATLDLEEKPATKGQNVWGVLEEPRHIRAGRQFRRSYRSYAGENGDPWPRAENVEMLENDEEPAFI